MRVPTDSFLVLILVVCAGGLPAQDFLKRIDCTFPANWTKTWSNRDAHRLERVYALDTIESAADTLTVDAFLKIADLPSPPLDSVGAYLAKQRPNTAVLCDCADGRNWRTLLVLEAYKEGKRRLALLRVGIKNKVRVDFSVNFPIQSVAEQDKLATASLNSLGLSGAGEACREIMVKQEKLAAYVRDFNSVCKSMYIDEKEACHALVTLAGALP